MAPQTETGFLQGKFLVAAITSVCSSGFLLFGYDQGVMSGIVISHYWLSSMGNPSTLMIGTITALYDVGAFAGAISAAFTAESLGRKRTLILGATIVIIGAILMGTSFERVQFMVARIVTGVGLVWLPDTPRWLMRCDGVEDRGLAVLARLRGLDKNHQVVQKEKDEILQAIAIEFKEEGTWKDLFNDGGISANKRFYLAVGIQFMQQLSGINIVTYYAPTLFQESLGMSQERSLLLGCFLQLFYILASFVTWWTIDRIGRRRLFISNAIGMCLVLIAEAICVAINTSASSIAAVVFVFAFEACFTWGWMATVWIYPPEILPLKIRAKGASLAAAADFLGNFLVVEITPPALRNIGYKTYIIFAAFNLFNTFVVWAVYPETAGLGLESVDRLFVDSIEMETRDVSLLGRLQWDVVRKAMEMRNEEKGRGFGGEGSEEKGIKDGKGCGEQVELVDPAPC